MRRKPGLDSEFETLIGDNQRRLYEYIFSMLPNHSAVDDILQETNRIVWEKRDQFELGTNFLAWARKIAHFQTLDFLKTSSRKGWLHFDTDLTQSIAKLAQANEEKRKSKSDALGICIQKLTESDQEIVGLRYRQKLSLKEIAVELSRSEGALKQVFRRIRRQLKECIERRMLNDEVDGSVDEDPSDASSSENPSNDQIKT